MMDTSGVRTQAPARNIVATLGVLLALLLTGTGFAQPLASVTPPGSYLAVEVRQEGLVGEASIAELEQLDWEQGLAIIQQAAESIGAGDEVAVFFEAFNGAGMDDTFSFCPALAPYFTYEDGEPIFSHYLISVGFAPFNPLPALNLVTTDYDSDKVDGIITELLACAAGQPEIEVLESDQDGTAVTTVTIDFDLSITFAQAGDFFIVSSNPDQARHSVRLASGSDEESLADSTAMQSDPAFEDGMFSMQWMVDFTVLSDLVMAFGGEFGPEAEPLVDRVNSLLLTLGNVRGNIAVQEGGLLFESVMYPDSNGGDEALFDLLTGSGLTLGSPPVAPSGAVGANSTTFDMTAATDYLQGWLDTASELIGEPLDLRETLSAMFGFDLDAELLDWLGNEVHMLQLDHSLSSLDSIYPGAGAAFILPVASGPDALAGFSGLVDRAQQAADMIAELEGTNGLEIAVRQREYRDHTIERVYLGPINDLAAAALGDNLVITIPGRAIDQVVDAWLDDEAADVPFAHRSGNLTAVSYFDTAGDLTAMAGFLDLLVQPIAYAARVSLLEEREWYEYDGNSFGGFGGFDWDAQDWSDGIVYGTRDLESIEYSVIEAGTVDSVITAEPGESSHATYFLLTGIEPGQEFTVSQRSSEFDSYLYLIDFETGDVIAYNDDYGSSRDSTIIYTASEGVTYLVEASSWGGSGTGAFVLDVSLSDAHADETAEAEVEEELPPVPSFAELFGVGELFPDALRVIAGRSGAAYGHTEVIGDTVRSRAFYEFDW